MKNKNLIPIMSVITGVLVIITLVLLFAIGPWKKSEKDTSLKAPKDGTEVSLTDPSDEESSDPDLSDPETDGTQNPDMSLSTEASSKDTEPELTSDTTPSSETATPTPEPTATPTPTPEPTKTPTPEPTAEPTPSKKQTPAGSYDLSGMVIVLDPGHQRKANSEQESVAPWSDETKPKVSAGTSGVATKRPEYEVVLEIGLKMRDYLESMGATVIMTRTSNDVNISNIERAKIATDNNADVFIRLHCDAADSSSTRGIGVFVCSRGELADSQVKWGDWLGNCLSDATGSKYRGCHASTTYSGLNWATSVPSFLLEMGYMTNPEDDRLLSDPDYQQKICAGCVAFCYKMKNR
ncbi:MAG: N-acetylmuramoyl-L-alanine amidase [Clostridiales bacterium]|nr:N-acetylmuramoyl-L-alanine amidase [Clostridiales bacterium]